MKVAVIGAGTTGLVAIKSCLEAGLHPVCFEKTDSAGGAWVYREDTKETDSATMYQGLRSNTSQFIGEYSDFPYPPDLPEFPSWKQHLDYLLAYARYFDLDHYINYNCEVQAVKPDGDTWTVTWSSRGEPALTEKFDAVMVCSGRFQQVIKPDIPGLERFKGPVLTANKFKHGRQKEIVGKKVLVIGNSYTAGDIACLASDAAEQVYLAIGKGCCVIGTRYQNAPLDCMTYSRNVIYSQDPMSEFRKVLVESYNDIFPDQEQYGICLSGADFLQRPMLYTNQDLPGKVRQGQILVKHIVESVTENEVVFSDGTRLQVDTVILATGYDISFPFLDKNIIADTVNDLELYKLVWPITTENHNLAILGCVKLIGVHVPFAELQSRWAVQVFKGNAKLPDKLTMRQEIKTRRDAIIDWTGYHSAQTDTPVLMYQDFMAEQIGARPVWWKYILRNPKLACILKDGVAFSCTYRLVGPSPWKGAEDRALELNRRLEETRNEGRGRGRRHPRGHILFALLALGLTGMLVHRFRAGGCPHYR